MANFFRSALKPFRKAAVSKSGQFALPSVIVVFIVLLVIYLIFETAKLSREKIRQQFALDSAAFAELQPEATYLNATAYVNAAFPYRAFRQMMKTPLKFANLGGTQENLTVYDYFYRAGAFPGSVDSTDKDEWNPKDSDVGWNLKYAKDTRPGWETENPTSVGDTPQKITSEEIAGHYEVTQSTFLNSFTVYFTVYNILGDTFAHQSGAYKSISKGGMFFKKSYYLNTGTCNESECGQEGAGAFGNKQVAMKPFNIKKVTWYYSLFAFGAGNQPQIPGTYSQTLAIKDLLASGNLFQFAYLDSGSLRTVQRLKNGIDVTQPFRPPDNYFNVDLRGYKPRVHARVALDCPANNNNCVWPSATPKYQVVVTP